MKTEVHITYEQILQSIDLDLDKISLALDLLGDIDDDALIQEVITYLVTCRHEPISSSMFESIRVKP